MGTGLEVRGGPIAANPTSLGELSVVPSSGVQNGQESLWCQLFACCRLPQLEK